MEGFNKENAFVNAKVLSADPKHPIKTKLVNIFALNIFFDLSSFMNVGIKSIDKSKCSKKTTVTEEKPSPRRGYLMRVSRAHVTQARNIRNTPI